jgi:hypothetical protein
VVGAAPAVPHWVRDKLNQFCQVFKTLSRVFNPESVVYALDPVHPHLFFLGAMTRHDGPHRTGPGVERNYN